MTSSLVTDSARAEITDILSQYFSKLSASGMIDSPSVVASNACPETGTITFDIEFTPIVGLQVMPLPPPRHVVQFGRTVFGILVNTTEEAMAWIADNCRDPFTTRGEREADMYKYSVVEFSERDAVWFKVRWF